MKPLRHHTQFFYLALACLLPLLLFSPAMATLHNPETPPINQPPPPDEPDPEEPEDPPAPLPQLSFSWQDTSGLAHRQVGINGRPFPQKAPQSSEETDQEPEKSSIDALTRHFRHSTSDVYIPLANGELALTVNRSARGEVWNERFSLSPAQEPDRPFGAGWASGLSANVHMVQPNNGEGYVLVTDENGSVHRFSMIFPQESISMGVKFIPTALNRTEQDVVFLQLSAGYQTTSVTISQGQTASTGRLNDIVFRRKFGTKLIFDNTPARSFVLATSNDNYEVHTYHRLSTVEDRMGNELAYEFDSGQHSLIPDRIQGKCAGGQNRTLYVTRLDPSDHLSPVQSISFPLGDSQGTIAYTYRPHSSQANLQLLDKVINAQGNITEYDYEEPTEIDSTASSDPPSLPNSSYHINLTEITTSGPQDVPGSAGLGGETTQPSTFLIAYEYDRSSLVFDPSTGQYDFPRGAPRTVASLAGPAGNVTVSDSGVPLRYFPVGGALGFQGQRKTTVTDAAGTEWHYSYSNPEFMDLKELKGFLGVPEPVHWPLIVAWKRLIVTSSGLSEEVNFHPEMGLAETSRVEASGNTVTYQHADPVPMNEFWPWAGAHSALPIFPKFFGDPTKEIRTFTDPFTQASVTATTEFVYDSSPTSRGGNGFSWDAHWAGHSRVMTGIIDAEGRQTKYSLDSNGQRISEEIRDESGVLLKRADFEYDTLMPGFMTREVTQLGGGTGLTQETVYTPDRATGNIATRTEVVRDPRIGTTNRAWTYLYDSGGNRTHETLGTPDGDRVTQFDYDDANRLIRVIYPQSDNGVERVEYGYDARGNRVWQRDEEDRYRLSVYDLANRKTKDIVDMDGNGVESDADLVTHYGYNAVGSLITVTSPRGNTTTTTYDALQRKQTVNLGGRTTTFSYDGPNAGSRISNPASFSPTSIRDARGYVTTQEFDGLYRNWRQTVFYEFPDANGATAVTRREFDRVGNITKLIEPLDLTTSFVYNGLNQPVEVTSSLGTPEQQLVTTTYTSTGWPVQVTEQITGGNRVTKKLYDSLGRERLVIQPNPGVVNHPDHITFTPPTPVPEPSTDPVIEPIPSPGDPVVPVTENIYNAAGNLAQVISPRGFATDFTYDKRGRQTAQILPLVDYFDEAGQPVIGAARERHTSTFDYDRVGNLLKTTDARGKSSVTFYDPANRPIGSISPSVPVNDPLIAGSTATRHPAMTSVYDKDGNILETWLGHASNQSSFASIVPLRRTALNTYTIHGELFTTTDAEDITVTNTYDDSGNRRTVRDGKSQTTTFHYDGLSRNTAIIDPTNESVSFTFNSRNLVKRTDSEDRVTEYFYDDRQRLEEVHYIGRSQDNRIYDYDLQGNILSVTEPGKAGKANVAYAYDALDRIVYESSGWFIHGQTHPHHYTYDSAGNRLTTVYGATGRTLISTYDAHNRLSTLTEATRVSTYGYDANGNVVARALPSTETIATTYDAVNRRSTIASANYSYTMEHDLTGNLVSSVEVYPQNTALNRTLENTYDAIGRLVGESISGAGAQVTTYGYDDAHNRDAMSLGGVNTSYTFNSRNQLTNFSDGTKTVDFIYDLNGNRTTRTVAGGNITSYIYDYENRLLKVTDASPAPAAVNVSLSHGYSPGNWFVTVWTPSGDPSPDWKSGDIIHITGTSDPSLVGSYTIGYMLDYVVTNESGDSALSYQVLGLPLDGPVYSEEIAVRVSPTQWYEYQYDYRTRRVERVENGMATRVGFSGGTSVQEIENSSLTVEFIRGSDWGGGVGGILYSLRGGLPGFNHYNSRGDVVAKTDATGSLTYQAVYEAFGTRTGEVGSTPDRQKANTKEEDPTGLLNEGFRYRCLETGVFITRDPLGFVDGPNMYAYVVQNPWTKFDPLGLETVRLQEVGVGGIFGTALNLKPQANALGMNYTKQSNPNFKDMRRGVQAAERGDVLVYNGHGGIVGGRPSIAAAGPAPSGEIQISYEAPGLMGRTKTQGTAYNLDQMSQDIAQAKGMPSMVLVAGCEISARDMRAITEAGVSVAISSGGKGDAAAAGPQMKSILDSLATGATVNEALAEVNKLVRNENESVRALMADSNRANYSAAFAEGLDGDSTMKDIKSHNEQTSTDMRKAKSRNKSEDEQ